MSIGNAATQGLRTYRCKQVLGAKQERVVPPLATRRSGQTHLRRNAFPVHVAGIQAIVQMPFCFSARCTHSRFNLPMSKGDLHSVKSTAEAFRSADLHSYHRYDIARDQEY